VRIAVLSDIHGTLTALDAVLRDLRSQAPDLVLHGGDVIGSGGRPGEIIDLIRSEGWPSVRMVSDSVAAACAEADIVATCTSATSPILHFGDLRPGTFVAAVGTDSEHKHEIAPDVLANSRVVADILDQCVQIGDLRHAIAAGAMTREDVHAELADVVTGRKRGRSDDAQIFVFDSTGTALEDVAAAALVYERATPRHTIDFTS
jgi:ornithine cyclodeaminase/alanine dehydrogenase-like protein (mu-crystallin family)